MLRILVFLSIVALSFGHTLPESKQEPKDDSRQSVELPPENEEVEFPEEEIRSNWESDNHEEDNDLYKDDYLYDLVYPDEQNSARKPNQLQIVPIGFNSRHGRPPPFFRIG